MVCADIAVAKLPPVTAWSGMPLPVSMRLVVPHDQLEVLVALTAALELNALVL